MDLIETIKTSRQKSADAVLKSLTALENNSEAAYRDVLLKELRSIDSFYPSGWYAPPPDGVAVLFSDAPYARLQFDTIRAEAYWPKENSQFNSESVGIIYCSPVDKDTGMIGDIGLTVYGGTDSSIQNHIKTCYKAMLEAAAKAEVGMRFVDLNNAALEIFKDNGLTIGWMTTEHDPLNVNLGHTIPGSDALLLERGNSTFEETKEEIRSKRIYINSVETYEIPSTCAFTFEARLTDLTLTKPNTFFHLVVTFTEGRREILSNFDGIFKGIRMNYMI